MDIDEKIRRGIRIAGWSMVALFLSPFVIMLVVRNLGPNAERQAALDLLHQPIPPVRGRDGSDDLWLLNYDVPEAQRAETAARLRKYLAAYDALDIEERDDEAKKLPDPREKMTVFPRVEDEPAWLCTSGGLGCLGTVRQDPAGAAAAVQAHAAALAAVDRLLSSDGTRWGLPPTVSQQVPVWTRQRRLARTKHALGFVQGRQLEAMAGVCRDIAGWRRQAAGTDLLDGAMAASTHTTQDLQLLSEMLAELPPRATLPVECAQALTPARPHEFELCLPMRAQFLSYERLYTNDMEAGVKGEGKPFVRAVVDYDHGVAVIAPYYAAFCGERMREAAARDRKLDELEFPAPKCSGIETIGDPITCWMAEQSSGQLRYQDRRTDIAAELALMRTVAWAHARGAGDPADFKGRPDSLGLRRPFVVSEDGREISIELFDKRRTDRFTLQLKPPPPAG